LGELSRHGVDGLAARKQLEAKYGPLPKTLQAETATGGLHDYFQAPESVIIRGSVGKLAAGVDVLANTMVVAPPTIRPGKGQYHYHNDKLAPAKLPPRWVAAILEAEAGGGDNVGDHVASAEPTAEAALVAAAMAVIRNNKYVGIPNINNWEFGWDDWNRVLMAIFRATGGSEEGFVIADAWSQKNGDKYNAKNTRKKWEGYRTSPPDQISFGTIHWLANKADPDWLRRYDNEQLAKQVEATRRARAKRHANTEQQGQQQKEGQQDQQKQEQEPQQEEEASTPLLFRLAERVWGPTTCVGTGEWQFGENVFVTISRNNAWQWFNEATGAHGTARDLMKLAGALYAKESTTDDVVVVRASDVQIRRKEWLWDGHLLRGALELLTGVPNLGKSQVHCSYVAHATTGRPWPDGANGCRPVNVIMVTAEDVLAQEVVPRLIAAGADLSRVHFLHCIREDEKKRQFLLAEDLDRIRRTVARIGDVGLITLDPITAYMGSKMDSHKVTEVRAQLGPLKDLARYGWPM
jgi:hypothetical protein